MNGLESLRLSAGRSTRVVAGLLAGICLAFSVSGCARLDAPPGAGAGGIFAPSPAPAPDFPGTSTAPAPSPAPQSGNDQATLPEGCASMVLPGGRDLDYCARPSTVGATSTTIIYFFHGLGGSAADLFKEPLATLVAQSLERLGAANPHFVSISLGPAGVIPVDSAEDQTTLAGEVTGYAFSRIESALGFSARTPPRRLLLGGSMGGYNVLSLSASRTTMFRAVASLCPALIDFDPFDDAQIEAYIERHKPYVRRDYVELAMRLLRTNFPTPAAWAASDPVRLVSQGRYDGLKLFMSVGRQDQFGYIEGARAFVAVAERRGLDLIWKPVIGPHCAFDPIALLDFIEAQVKAPGALPTAVANAGE